MVSLVSVEDLRVGQSLAPQGEEVVGCFGNLPKANASAPECLLARGADRIGEVVPFGAEVGVGDDGGGGPAGEMKRRSGE